MKQPPRMKPPDLQRVRLGTGAGMMVMHIVDVKNCPRCGQDHNEMSFTPLVAPSNQWTHWGMCPVKDEPLLLAHECGDKKAISHPEKDLCPQCGALLVFRKDDYAYCVDCGYPNENRTEQPVNEDAAKGGNVQNIPKQNILRDTKQAHGCLDVYCAQCDGQHEKNQWPKCHMCKNQLRKMDGGGYYCLYCGKVREKN